MPRNRQSERRGVRGHVDLLGSALKGVINPAGRWLVGWLARFQLLQLLAVRRYRRRLARMYGTFTPKSGPVRDPLRMSEMYLPLAVESPGRAPIEEVIAIHRRVVVTGEPGTGKSMLLRHLAYEFAEGRGSGRIPLRVELHRLEGNRADLDRYLVEQLTREGFYRAENFVERGLATGGLRVLLDGLDEVSHAYRAAVVRQILAFLDRYPSCEVVITCRTAVREVALLARVHTAAIAELDDQLIAEYVRRRLGLRPDTTATLLRALFDNPRILALARVPLLLDMMIAMYAEGRGARFPVSRAEFYAQAVDFLLTPWHAEHTTDPDRIEDMRRTLRRLALTAHDNLHGSWLTLDRDIAIATTANLLGIERLPARELLTEIVERTGLLHRADGGYRFAHLTFQEFLAAEALRDDPDGLLDRFRTDPDRWLEPVVLWCRATADPAPLIQALLDAQSPVALECLSEATSIDRDLVRRVVTTFAGRLHRPGVARAFGLAATNSEAVVEFLENEVNTARTARRRGAAASALAASNLPRAAVFLGARYGSMPEVREPMERMRDLAVDVLAASVRPDDTTPLDALLAIGTASAVHAMIPVLWHPDSHLAASAAWRLAVLLRDPQVADSLARYRLKPGQRGSSNYDWIWKPFTEDETTRTVVSRICELLKEGPDSAQPPPGPPIHGRLAIPLGVICGLPLPAREQLDAFLESTMDDEDWYAALLRKLYWPKRERILLRQVPRGYLVKLIKDGPKRAPTPKDWQRVYARPRDPRLLISVAWAVTGILGLAQVVLTFVQTGRSGAAIGAPLDWVMERITALGRGMGLVLELVWTMALHEGTLGISIFGLRITVPLLLPVVILVLVTLIRIKAVGVGLLYVAAFVAGVAMLSVVLTMVALLLTMPTAWLHEVTGSWWGVLAGWLVALAVPAAGVLATHRQRVWQRNPLRVGHSLA
jgi:NACHT domain